MIPTNFTAVARIAATLAILLSMAPRLSACCCANTVRKGACCQKGGVENSCCDAKGALHAKSTPSRPCDCHLGAKGCQPDCRCVRALPGDASQAVPATPSAVRSVGDETAPVLLSVEIPLSASEYALAHSLTLESDLFHPAPSLQILLGNWRK